MSFIQFELKYKDTNKNLVTILHPSLRNAIKERSKLQKEGKTVISRKIITDFSESTKKVFPF